MSSNYSNGMTYQECVDNGREGELFALNYLDRALDGSGLTVRDANLYDHHAPFDIEVLDGDKVIVAIDNKDASKGLNGIWQKGPAIKRKLRYAKKLRTKTVLTTITIRDKDLLGFSEGLVSQRIIDFNFWREDLLKEILSARRAS